MTYRQLQLALKQFRNAGKTNIKLNGKKTALQAEYDRLMQIEAMALTALPAKATPKMVARHARIERLFEEFWANQEAELANAAKIYAVATMAVKKLA